LTPQKKQDMQFSLLLQIAPIYVHTAKYSKHVNVSHYQYIGLALPAAGIDQQANPSILICITSLVLFLVNNAESHGTIS